VRRPYRLVDVFTDAPYRGNPVAVVLDGTGLTTEGMQRVANWMNLSETTFVLPPDDDAADYRVRIFTPVTELPFAGHPTLGTCHAWLEAGGAPRQDGVIVQQCPAGLVSVHAASGRLAFAAPPLLRSGPADDSTIGHVAALLSIDRAEIEAAEWVDNGPGWIAVLLGDVDRVLALQPGRIDQDIGVVALFPPGAPEAIEVRAFFPKDGLAIEDPVTGSLNASLAQWLLGSGRLTAPYVARQGTALGRAGRVEVAEDGEGTIWIGGGTVTSVVGEVEL
jgi:PhzF family phenazine biosynthesis protein